MQAPADTAALLRTIGRIRIRTRKIVSELLAGSYRSAFRGSGLEFDEVREYTEGDDLRAIDWNVTARTGNPFIKTYHEERERTLFLLVDVSGSTGYGSRARTKAQTAAEICAVLALSAAGSQDRVGLVAFSDRVEHHVPARRGTRHALRVVRDVLSLPSTERGTRITCALDMLARTRLKRGIVFVISDFMDSGYERAFGAMARRHDLIAVRIVGPVENALPAGGLVQLRDPETGRIVTADLSSCNLRERYESRMRASARALADLCAHRKADLLEVSTAEPIAAPLRAFVERRRRRYGR